MKTATLTDIGRGFRENTRILVERIRRRIEESRRAKALSELKTPFRCPKCGHKNSYLIAGRLNETNSIWTGKAILKCVGPLSCGSYTWKGAR